MAEEGIKVGSPDGSLMERPLPIPACCGEDSGGLLGPPEDPGVLCHHWT